MNILVQVADYVHIIGSACSIAIGCYFVIKAIINSNLSKKPFRDAKKREKVLRKFAELSKELGFVDEVKDNEKTKK